MSYLASAKILEPGRLVMDPAMLRILTPEKIRDIAVIAMHANLTSIRAVAKAQQEVIKEVSAMKF